MSKEYIIPIGLKFVGQEGIADTSSTLEELKKQGGEVGKSLSEGLSKGAAASERLDKEIVSNNENLKEIREMAKLAGKGFAESFKTNDIKKMEKELSKFKKTTANLTANVDLNLDEQKLEILNRQLDKAEDEFDELRIAVGMFKNVLDSLDPDSTEFKELNNYVQFLEQSLTELDAQMEENVQSTDRLNNSGINVNATFEEVYGTLQPMTTRLGELEDRMYELALAGGKNTKEFKTLEAEAVRLRKTIVEVDASVDNFAKSSAKIDAVVDGATGLVGAFTAVQGATALWGDENEELEKALLKVNGAMAVLQGLQAVTATLSKESAFNTVFLTKAKAAYNSTIKTTTSLMGLEATATGGATLATKAFSFALKTIGIGLIITAIALLVEYWDDLTEAVEDFIPSGVEVGKVFDQIKSYALGVGNAILQFVIAPYRALIELVKTRDIDKAMKVYSEGLNVVNNFNEAKRGQDLRNEKKYLIEKEKKQIEFAKRDLERRKNRGEDVYKAEQDLLKREKNLLKREGKDTAEIQKQIEDNNDKRFAENVRRRQQAQQKAAQQAQQRREQAAERRAEFEKKSAEQLLTLDKELNDARIRNISDNLERERAELKKSLDDKINNIEEEVALTAEAERRKTELLKELEKERTEKLKEFDEKAAAERIEMEVEKRKAILETKEETLEREIELIDQNWKAEKEAIQQNYKDDVEFQKELIEAKEKELVEKKKETRLKYEKDRLAEEEEIALLNVDLAEKYAEKSIDTERQKQVAIQELKLKYAKKNLELLLKSGKSEESLEVLRAKKVVKNMSEALDEAVKNNNNKPFDLLEFLGIGKGLSSEEKSLMMEGFKTIYNNLSALTDFVVEQYDKQIEAKRESINQLDNEISDMEDRLESEKELREEGLANEADTLEEQLEIKREKREEEVRQAEEILKKKKQIQKAQMAADTALQVVNMVTASTEIFKSFAKLPFGIGIPLAVGVIASMFGAFTVAKIKAYKAINDQSTKFRKGGRIGGKRHNEGGTKFVSESGERIELERDEFVVRRDRYKKYPKFIEAFNSGDFSKISSTDMEMVNLFNELGGFEMDISSAKASGETFKRMNSEEGTLKSIDKGIKDLNEKEEIIETEKYVIMKSRNRIRRIKK